MRLSLKTALIISTDDLNRNPRMLRGPERPYEKQSSFVYLRMAYDFAQKSSCIRNLTLLQYIPCLCARTGITRLTLREI